MAENKNSANQILDVARNMGDIMSQVKGKISGKNETTSGDLDRSGFLGGVIDPVKSLNDVLKKLGAKSPEDKLAPPDKKQETLNFDRVNDILGGEFPLKGALEKGGEVKEPGNYLVGEDGPEVVNLPEGSSVIPLDVEDLIEGLSRVPEIRKSIVDNKINVDTKNRLIKTDTGDFSVDMLVKNYSAEIDEDRALGIDTDQSVLALSSLQKLSEKIAKPPVEIPAAPSEAKPKSETSNLSREKETIPPSNKAFEKAGESENKEKPVGEKKIKGKPETAEESLSPKSTRPDVEKSGENKGEKSTKGEESLKNSKTAEQKLLSKTKGPTPSEIEAEKKRLLAEDPDWYSDSDNLNEEIDYFVRSYDFNEESVKKMSPEPKKEEIESNTLERRERTEKSKSIEESPKLLEKSKSATADQELTDKKSAELKKEPVKKEIKGESSEKEKAEKSKAIEEKPKLSEKSKPLPADQESVEKKSAAPKKETANKKTSEKEAREKTGSKQETANKKIKREELKEKYISKKEEKVKEISGRKERRKAKRERSEAESQVINPRDKNTRGKGEKSRYGLSLSKKLEGGLKNRGKKAGRLDVNKVMDLITGKTPVKGALRLGGEVQEAGDYLVGENGPEIVNLPAKNPAVSVDVSDLIEGLSKISEINKYIVDGKIEVNPSSRTIEADDRNISLDALERGYLSKFNIDKSRESALIVSSLQKLSNRISSIPAPNTPLLTPKKEEASLSESKPETGGEKIEKGGKKEIGAKTAEQNILPKNKLGLFKKGKEEKKSGAEDKNELLKSQSQTVEQKLTPKAKGPTPVEIEAEKKRLLEEDPDWYGDPKNLEEEIKYFIESYDFNSENSKKMLAPSARGKQGEITNENDFEEKSRSVEESIKLSEKTNPPLSESKPSEITSRDLKNKEANKSKSDSDKKGILDKLLGGKKTGEGKVEKTALAENKKGATPPIPKAEESAMSLSKKVEKPEGALKSESPKKEEKEGLLDKILGKKKKESEKSELSAKGEKSGKSAEPVNQKGGEGSYSKEGANSSIKPGENTMSLSSKIKENVLSGGENKEPFASFGKIFGGKDKEGKELTGAKSEKKPGSPGLKGAASPKLASLVTNPLQKIKKIEGAPVAPGTPGGKGGILGKITGKDKGSTPGKIGSFKESLEGKLSAKIPDIKGKLFGDKKEGEKSGSLVKGGTNPLKQQLSPEKLISGAKPGDIKGKVGGIPGDKAKIEKSVSALSLKSPDNKQPEKPKESTKSPQDNSKAPTAPPAPKETKEEKPAPKTNKGNEKSGSKSSEGGSSDSGNMDDIKGLLSQIAISLSSPVTFYNPDPFRPDSRRI